MASFHIPNWVYLPVKLILLLALLSPVWLWSAMLLNISIQDIQHLEVTVQNDINNFDAANVSKEESLSPDVRINEDNKHHGLNDKYTHGIDVSHYQGSVNWKSVKDAGVHFSYIKATGGKSFVDPKFHLNWHEARATQLRRGAYHFFLPEYDAKDQADHFIKTVGKLNADDLPPMLDVEISDKVRVKEMEKDVLLWLSIVEREMGRRPVVYTDNGFADDVLTNKEFAKYPLWIADYAKKINTLPNPWKRQKWTIWQYSEKGKVQGVNGSVDLNRFNGSPTELIEFIQDSYRK